jgi:hypothetical protein
VTRRPWIIAAVTFAVLLIASYTHEIILVFPHMAGCTVIGPFTSPKALTRSAAQRCAYLQFG